MINYAKHGSRVSINGEILNVKNIKTLGIIPILKELYGNPDSSKFEIIKGEDSYEIRTV